MFFSEEIGIELPWFGFWHLLQIFITIFVVFFIIRYKDHLRNYKHEKRVRIGIGITLIILELSIHLWYLFNNSWELTHRLPLDLCTINIYLSIVLIFTKNRNLFSIIYFWGFGAVLSVLFPDVPYGPDRFRYYQFFFAHMMFLWIYMYMIFVHRFHPTVKEFFRSCMVLFVLAIGIVLPINFLLNENYMFVVSADGTPLEIYEHLGQFWYTSITVVVIFFVALLWYSPIYLYLRKNKLIQKVDN